MLYFLKASLNLCSRYFLYGLVLLCGWTKGKRERELFNETSVQLIILLLSILSECQDEFS